MERTARPTEGVAATKRKHHAPSGNSARANRARGIRLLVGTTGCALMAYALRHRGRPGYLIGGAGGLMVAAAVANLPFRRVLGSGPDGKAVHLERTMDIDAPPEVVFEFWRNFESFPRFMTNVRDVRAGEPEGRSHWTVSGPGGVPLEFDAVLTEYIPNQLIAWRTVGRPAVTHAGSVRFLPAGAERTRIHVRLSYSPPGGPLGRAAVRLLGDSAAARMGADLSRLKALIETGDASPDAAQPSTERIAE